MIVLVILLLFLAFSLCYSYDKSIAYTASFSVLLMNIKVYTAYSLFDVYVIIACILLFIRKRNKYKMPFYLFASLVVLAFSFVVSSYLSINDKHYIFVLVKEISAEVLFLFIIWTVFCNNRYNFSRRFIRGSLILASLIGLMTVSELIAGSNLYIKTMVDWGLMLEDNLIEGERFGLKRTQSFFTMHITSGTVSFALLFLLWYCKSNILYLSRRKQFVYIVVGLLFLSVFSTGSRACILGMTISLLYIIAENMKWRNMFSLLICVAIICFVLSSSSFFGEIINSFVDTNNVNGSNANDREKQFAVALFYLMRNPIFGNGTLFCYEHVMVSDPEILGAESLWMPVMIDRGIIGVLSYVLFFASVIYYCINNRVWQVVLFVIGFITINTLSSIPNFVTTFVLVYVIVMVYLKKEKNNRTHILI